MISGSKLRKGVLAMAVVAATGLGSLLATSSAAQAASGGGCSSWSQSIEGVSVQACINASGITINADGWARGSSSKCYVQVTLLNSSYQSLGTGGTQSCTSGHHTGPSGVYWGTYYSEMCVYDLYSTNFRCMISPAIHNP
jgi:hypothetical protein